MYCEKCRQLTDAARCPTCRSAKLRVPDPQDLCFLTQKEPIWGPALSDLLAARHISFETENLLGAGLATSIGPLFERVNFYVPYSQLSAAQTIEESFFGQGAADDEADDDEAAPDREEECNQHIRFACEEDVHIILAFIRALAEYEHLSDEVVATPELLKEWLFERHTAEVLIAQENDEPVGFALFFHNFSTFLGRGGIYLEDLFVLPEYRGRGHGRALLTRLAYIAKERGCGRLEWSCLDWNKPSIDFYLSMGAKPMDGWKVYRLTGDTLEHAAALSAEE